MELNERYIYAVTKGLPQKQREDIGKELRTLIDDMLEQEEGPETQELKLQNVLLSLGDPELLAESYRDSKRYLIGPQNYDNYLLILKIVFGAVFLGISVAMAIAGLFSEELRIGGIIGGYLSALFSGLAQAFAWVTLAFAIAEGRGVDMRKKQSGKEAWSLELLPEIPEKKAAIPPAEPIAAILFSTLFIALLYFAPQLLAVYIPRDPSGMTMVPVFDTAMLREYRLLLAGMYIFNTAKEALKLVSGRWTIRLSVIFSLMSILSAALALIVFSNPSIWNPNFAAEIIKYANAGFEFLNVWLRLTTWIIMFIILGCFIDVSTALYKGFKYNAR